MGRKIRYLGPSERAEIERLHNRGAPAAVIAEKVGSHACLSRYSNIGFPVSSILSRACKQGAKLKVKTTDRPGFQ